MEKYGMQNSMENDNSFYIYRINQELANHNLPEGFSFVAGPYRDIIDSVLIDLNTRIQYSANPKQIIIDNEYTSVFVLSLRLFSRNSLDVPTRAVRPLSRELAKNYEFKKLLYGPPQEGKLFRGLSSECLFSPSPQEKGENSGEELIKKIDDVIQQLIALKTLMKRDCL